MKTICTTVYTFAELSEAAQQKAYQDHLNAGIDYAWQDEANDTRDAFVALFPALKLDRDGDFYTGNMDDDILELKGKRLAAWLWNNVLGQLLRGKMVYKGGVRAGMKSRTSRIILTADGPLTGYCMDDEILQPLWDFVHGVGYVRYSHCHGVTVWGATTLASLLGDCENAFKKAIEADEEYQSSFEYFKESCEANEWHFTEQGKMKNC